MIFTYESIILNVFEYDWYHIAAPVIGIFVESELWPNLIDAAHTRGARGTSTIMVRNTFGVFRSSHLLFWNRCEAFPCKRENVLGVVPTLELSIRPRIVAQNY